MPVYLRAKDDDQAVELVADVMRRHHPWLAAEEVTVGVLFVAPGEHDEPGEPVLKHAGYQAAAVIKITSYKQRVLGLPDATLSIDEPTWGTLTDAQREALIDHELTHLQTVTDAGGLCKHDDAGRPRIKIRLHDWQLGGFREVVERHGEDALERVAFEKTVAFYGQLLLDFQEA